MSLVQSYGHPIYGVLVGERPFAEPGIYSPPAFQLPDPEGRDCFVFGQDRGLEPGLPHDRNAALAVQDRGPEIAGREEAQVSPQEREVTIPRKTCKGA